MSTPYTIPVIRLELEGFRHTLMVAIQQHQAAIDKDIKDAVDQYCEPENIRRVIQSAARDTLTTIIQLELTAIQALTLCLIATQGDQRMTDIAKACRISTAGATGLVDALEQRQLVKRYPAAHDRRSYIVTITPKAKDLTTTILGSEIKLCEFCHEPPLTPRERQWMKENFDKKGDSPT